MLIMILKSHFKLSEIKMSYETIFCCSVISILYCSKCSKISNAFHVLFLNKMLVIWAGIHKMFVRIANREDLIRLLVQKQSGQGLHCLSSPFLAGS